MKFLHSHHYPANPNCGIRYLSGIYVYPSSIEDIKRDLVLVETGKDTTLSYWYGLVFLTLYDRDSEALHDFLIEHGWKEAEVFHNPAHQPWQRLHFWTRITDASVERTALIEKAEKKKLDKKKNLVYNNPLEPAVPMADMKAVEIAEKLADI